MSRWGRANSPTETTKATLEVVAMNFDWQQLFFASVVILVCMLAGIGALRLIGGACG